MDRGGCAALVVIAVIWALLMLDVNVWRHLTGPAVALECFMGVMFTFAILLSLTPRGPHDPKDRRRELR